MRLWLSVVAVAILALAAMPVSVVAQQKTVKQCQDEWRANKDENKAKGITEKTYVAQCRGEAAAQPAPAPATGSTAAPAAPAAETKKTVKACQAEWRANKDAYKAASISEKAYVEKCQAGEAVAVPTAPPVKPTATAPAAPPPEAPAAPPPPKPAAKASTTAAVPTPSGAGQFASEAQAKSSCVADIVVWVNLNSKIYHFAGYKNYGTTEHGAYMCEKQAVTQGFRASKVEKRPGA